MALARLLSPGGTAWLLAHEVRLSVRTITSRKGAALVFLVLGLVLAVVTAFGGVPLALLAGRTGFALEPVSILAIDAGIVVVFTLILSQTLSSAVSSFYDRGDLDLLLSSPLSPRRILMVRAVSVAVRPFLWFALFLTPLAAPLAILNSPRWLASYLVLASIALLAGAAGLSIAMALFRLIGARATKTAGQLIAAVIGAAFFLISQLRNLLPDQGAQIIAVLLKKAQTGFLSPGMPLAWPAEAVAGAPVPLMGVMALAGVAFVLTASALARRFAADAAAAAGADAGLHRVSRGGVAEHGFRDGVFVAMLKKELRLLIRDPTLLSQVLLRTLYVLPLTFLLARNAMKARGAPLHTAIHLQGLGTVAYGAPSFLSLDAGAGALAFLAGQVAGSLAWITISAEEAPELLACAPVDGSRVRQAKLAATMLPVALLLTPPLLGLTVFAPWVGSVALVGAAGSAASAGLINLWFEKPASRKAFRNRRGGSVLGAIAELILGLEWGVTTGMLAALSPYAVIPAAITLLTLGLLYGLANPVKGY